MKVKMKVAMSGTRNGVEWPQPGEEVTLPKGEAVKMCEAGLAVPVAEWDDKDDVEYREKPVEVGPDSEKENKKDADRSARAAEKRSKQAAPKAKPKASEKF